MTNVQAVVGCVSAIPSGPPRFAGMWPTTADHLAGTVEMHFETDPDHFTFFRTRPRLRVVDRRRRISAARCAVLP